jgi:hypothetical protein
MRMAIGALAVLTEPLASINCEDQIGRGPSDAAAQPR